MPVTIETFWRHILPTNTARSTQTMPGWYMDCQPLTRFTEAPQDFSDFKGEIPPILARERPLPNRKLWLVSAPGAVGKTTLAREICATTGAIYIDLARAQPVAGHFISGGLVDYGMLQEWQSGTVGMVIDALDEAQLRVPDDSFIAFLSDVWTRAQDDNVPPPILFGRSSAIEAAIIALVEHANEIGVIDIGFYTPDAAVRFTLAAEEQLITESPSPRKANEHDKTAITLILESVRSEIDRKHETSVESTDALTEGRRFAGYAPVLMAVARRVASEENPYVLVNQLQAGGADVVDIVDITSDILKREQTKIQWDGAALSKVAAYLYTPAHQLGHLSAGMYETDPPEPPGIITINRDRTAYADKVKEYVESHPFLAGRRDRASTAVFGAQICAHALLKRSSRAQMEQLNLGQSANPFLLDFYLQLFGEDIEPEHVGIIYNSIRSRLSLDERASLLIFQSDTEPASFDVEITVRRRNQDEVPYYRGKISAGDNTDGKRSIELGPHVVDVDVDIPQSNLPVRIGFSSDSVNIVAPTSVVCKKLIIDGETLQVSYQSDSTALAYLAAMECESRIVNEPRVHTPAILEIEWPNGRKYPWSHYFGTVLGGASGSLTEHEIDIYNRLRKFIFAFRSRGKEQLARSSVKIESNRMTSGSGRKVLDRLCSEGVVRQDGYLYILDPKRLYDKTGLTYVDCRVGRLTDNFRMFADSVS